MPKVLPTFEEGARAEGWRGLRLAALCVGVGAYAKHAKLDNTVRDAEAVYRAVNACPGCRAAIIRDPPDKKTIRKHLRAFLEELAPTGGNSAPPETVLLFVAGHGVQLGHHVYLIPTAASSDDETDLSEDCLSHLTLFEWLHRFLDAPAKDAQPKRFDVKFAVILDVCREPAAVPDAHSGQVLVSIDPERGAAPERWALCYSTSRGSVALDGDAGSHSPLAFGMLDARSGICAPGVALKQGIENACAAVRESTRQRPITVTLDVLGDFVLQPGPDREVPPGLPGTLSCSLLPSGRCLRVFLGYRVDSDQDLVERLYYQLKSEGIDVWWDARCLPPGQPWEEGFADGLCSSDVFVPVISKAALAPFASLKPESRCDNVLLEHQLALELKMRGKLHCIFPVFVGVLKHDGELGEMYGDFFKGGGIPNCPEVIVGSVEAKLSEHLFRKGKGVPQLPDAQRKVAGTLKAITEHQGVMLSGIKRDAFQKVVVGIVHACGAHRASPFVQHESAHKRARESDMPEAGDASKVARAHIDSRLSKAAGKRPVDTSEGSSSDAKRTRQDSASASMDSDRNELVRFGGAAVDHGPPWDFIRGAYEFDVFISHAWDEDDEGRDNHARAKRLNEGLQKLKIKTWFDDGQMQGNILQRRAEGIERSAVILICVTRNYMEKVAQDTGNCQMEFNYAHKNRTELFMLTIVMEESMTDTTAWTGGLGLVLGNHLYCKLTSDVDADFDRAVAKISESVDKMMQDVLSREQQTVAKLMSSRSPSPAQADLSGASTPVMSQSPPPRRVVAMHVDNKVNKVRDDLGRLIKAIVNPSVSEAPEKPAPRQRTLCELLLVAFVRDKVAPSIDSGMVEELKWWKKQCFDPDANVVECFCDMMTELKPSVLEEIKFQFQDNQKPNFVSIFAIDWMVRDSPWALDSQMAKKEWQKKVVGQCLEDGNAESAHAFSARAETFLCKGEPGETWGLTILGKVIETQSYVVFLQVGSLAALLLREFFNQQHASEPMQQDFPEPAKCGPSLPPINLVVSSSNWHWSSEEGDDISEAHKASITARLQRMASLPSELLEANSHYLSQIEDAQVKCVPLYSLKERQQKYVDKSGLAWEPEGGWDASFSKILSMLARQKDFFSKEPKKLPETPKASASIDIADIERKIKQGRYASNPQEFHSDALLVFRAHLCHDEVGDTGPRRLHEPGAAGGHEEPADLQVRCEDIWAKMQAILGSGTESTPAAAGGAFVGQAPPCDLIHRYLEQLVEERRGRKNALSVGTYIDSASGEEHKVDGTETIAVVLVSGPAFNQHVDVEDEKNLKCPISRSIMRDPVTCSDGRTYERAWIESWALLNPSAPETREPLEFEDTADGPRLRWRRNDDVRARIEAFKKEKLAELERRKQCAEGEEERQMLRSRYGLKISEGIMLKDNNQAEDAVIIDSAQDFLEFVTTRSPLGLACLIGPPASGKTVMMQQIVYAAVKKCKAQMEHQGSVPFLPIFMRASVLSSLISESESKVDQSKVVELRQWLELFLEHGFQQGIFPEGLGKFVLELYDQDRILICIDGLDEAAGHQELLEASIEHAVKDAADSHRRVHVLLSTREHSYAHSRACLRLGDFDVVNLQPLNEARQQQMIQGRIPRGEVNAFREQLDAIAGKNQELATSPFLLSLMIEVYQKEGEIPSRRVDLYDKQVKAIVNRCIQARLKDHEASGSLVAKTILNEKLLIATRFLETLAFVCQMCKAARDFKLDECASKVSELWQDGEAARTEAQQLLFTPRGKPLVGLLADVGDGSCRFSHLTLQEYLAAKCAVRLYAGASARKILDQFGQGDALFSRWKREVLKFTACLLPEEMFSEFCQALLERDDGTGACCELVRDFLQERGASEAVERMMRDQMQQNRGADLLIAGLCHPCPEMRSRVLSEMKQFCVPPSPFADGTVARLKEIAKDSSRVWHTRAAAMLSLAQIAQMKHWETSRTDRAETMTWMLNMLHSDRDVLENVNVALVKALGTMLQEGGVSAAGDGIMLQPEDESVLLQPSLRESVATAETVATAISDLKLFSAGLVDWLEREPSLIAHGQWPIKHTHFLCENVAASNDSGRASRLVGSLLHRLHSSSSPTSDRMLLLKGLGALQLLVAADLYSQVLPFLESGDVEQRARVLEAAVEIKVQFKGEDAIGRLARCLLLDVGPASTHAVSETSLLSYVLTEAAEKCKGSSLREKSAVFVFISKIMEQSSGDSQQVVSRYLTDFEKAYVGEKVQQSKKEQEDSDAQDNSVKTESLDAPDAPELLTTNAESINQYLRDFVPGNLDKKDSSTKLDVCERYCAVSLWTSSDLIQEFRAEKIARWLVLRKDDQKYAAKAFEDLKQLQEPWMKGREGTNGEWEEQVFEALQRETLGRFIFAMLLSYIGEKVKREPSRALEGFALLSEKIRRWDAETPEKRLERQFLLKELCIGRRNDHLPSWSGGVTKMRTPHGPFKYHIFVSHNWGAEPEFKDHKRAEKLNRRLQDMGFKTWFDSERMSGQIIDKITRGIEESAVFLACITRSYVDKVAQEEDPNDHVKLEFNHARRMRKAPCMLAIVMEEDMTDTAVWTGSVGATLGDYLYVKLIGDSSDAFEQSVQEIAGEVEKRLANVLPDELQGAAYAMSSRSHAPAPSEMSGASTAAQTPFTPFTPPPHEVVAMHVDNDVREFRDDMKKLIEGFLTPQSGAAGDQPAPRQFRLCELLLVAFMRDKVAPSCDAETAENLYTWQESCVNPAENLFERFHEIMSLLKPPVLAEINLQLQENQKKDYISIYVIDWVVQRSSWKLPVTKHPDWEKQVVQQWFEAGDVETAEAFVKRAESFLEVGVRGQSWGARILGRAIDY